MKARQLLKKLQLAGVVVSKGRGKGGHYWLAYESRRTTFPFHGNMDLGPEFIKTLCKQLGLDPREVL